MSKTVWIAGIGSVVLTAVICAGIIYAASTKTPPAGEAAAGSASERGEEMEMDTEIQLSAAEREALKAGAPAEGPAGGGSAVNNTADDPAGGGSAVNNATEGPADEGSAVNNTADDPADGERAGESTANAPSQAPAAPQALVVDSDPQMYTYDQMVQDLQAMSAAYPEQVSLDSLTDTPDGRCLWHLVIGDQEKAGRHILVTASIHAREYMTTQLVMKQTSQFLKNIENYQGVLDGGTAIHVVPMINPDGVSISQMGLDGCLEDETRDRVLEISRLDGAKDMDSYLRRWKSNSQGVDLNRNFDALWESYNDGLGRPSADHYKGTAPGCEPEAAALIALTERYPFARTVSYHTQGNVIYWYFGQTGELKEATQALANKVSAVTGYPTDANYEKLDPAGYKDWAISKKGIPSLTIEVGSETSPVPASQFQAVWRANMSVWDVLLQE